MNRISIGAALGEGFSLMRRRPLTVLAWGAFQGVVAALAWALYLPFYMSMIGRIASTGASGAAAAPDPAMMAQMMQMQGFSLLLSLANAVVGIMVYCAVFRAVLAPEQRRFAYLRVGAPELLLLVVAVAAYFAFIVALVVVMVPSVIIVGVLGAAHQIAAAVVVGILIGVGVFVALVYFGLRFSLTAPMTVRDGTLRLSESWALTKGHVGPLFVIFIAQIGILMLAELVLVVVLFALGAAALGVTAGGFTNIPQFFKRPPQEIVSLVAPWLIGLGILFIPISGALIAFMGAPWARVLRDLTHSDALDAFT
jgi:hypothetical protein